MVKSLWKPSDPALKLNEVMIVLKRREMKMNYKISHIISQGVFRKILSFIHWNFPPLFSLIKSGLFCLPLRLFELQILMSFELCSLIKVGQKHMPHATVDLRFEIHDSSPENFLPYAVKGRQQFKVTRGKIFPLIVINIY